MGLRALNNTESPFEDVFSGTGGIANAEGAPATGMNASGGTTQTYTTPTGLYKSHTFLSPGTFIVSSVGPSAPKNEIDYLLVGGGGAGGVDRYDNRAGGGGGAGAVVYKTGIPVSGTGSYSVVVGPGGAGNLTGAGDQGTASTLTGGNVSVTSAAGGGGGANHMPGNPWGQSTTGGSSGGGTNGTGPGPSGGVVAQSGSSGHPGATDVASPDNMMLDAMLTPSTV